MARFHRDLGGFFISYFSDHDDVRILAQKRPQSRREIKTNS